MEDLQNAVGKVLEAWKAIPQEGREKFNEAAGGQLVDALRGLNVVVESGSEGAQAPAQKAGDVCQLPDGGGEGVLEEQEVDGEKKLVCVPKAA